MVEKRKYKRLPIELRLEISSLFKQDNIKMSDIEAPIHVTDISRGGIRFTSANDLPLDYYFNACIQLSEEDDAKLFSVVKIIRKEVVPDGENVYGCELVGVAPVLSYIFEDFEKKFE